MTFSLKKALHLLKKKKKEEKEKKTFFLLFFASAFFPLCDFSFFLFYNLPFITFVITFGFFNLLNSSCSCPSYFLILSNFFFPISFFYLSPENLLLST